MQDIYVSDNGKGFPLVLVHGFLGSSEIWKLQKIFLSKYFRVVAPAISGFGESSKKKSYKSIKQMAKSILKCLNLKGIKKFNLLGHSMGGMIVQEIANIDQKKINKLILYSTGALGSMPGRFEKIDESRRNLKVQGLKKTTNKIFKTWFVKGCYAKNFYLCEKFSNVVNLNTADNALIAMKKWNGLNNLKNIKKKTLIIWGNKDKSYTLNQAKILKKNISTSKLVIFKNCAHNIHLENPSRFNKIVKDFLID